MARLSQNTAQKDYSLLADQPSSVAGLDQKRRNATVISAVSDGNGISHVLRKSCKTPRSVWYMSACNGILTGHEAKQP